MLEDQVFLNSGTTRFVLYLAEKNPVVNDRFASSAIRGAIMSVVCLSTEAGRTSSSDNFAGSWHMAFATSLAVTGGRLSISALSDRDRKSL